MVRAKKYLMVKRFEGEPKRSDLQLVEEELPALKDGEYLIEAEFLSVDPYMRVQTRKLPLGSVMIGRQISKIIESKNQDYPVGQLVVANVGWRTHTVVDPTSPEFLGLPPYLLPDFGGLPASLGLGVLGRTGNSAYFPIIEILKPKAGETLVVSGAAGAVGSHVGQIGKILGLKVIGIAGSDSKCKWIKEVLGFDHAINYKTQDVAKALAEAAPNKIDCYFDNVGGEISTIVYYQMNLYGRVAVCGSISCYNSTDDDLPKCTITQRAIINSQLKIEGFMTYRWEDRLHEGIMQNLKWVKENKIKYRETVTKGFENMFEAFLGVLRGDNTGKSIVKV